MMLRLVAAAFAKVTASVVNRCQETTVGETSSHPKDAETVQ